MDGNLSALQEDFEVCTFREKVADTLVRELGKYVNTTYTSSFSFYIIIMEIVLQAPPGPGGALDIQLCTDYFTFTLSR